VHFSAARQCAGRLTRVQLRKNSQLLWKRPRVSWLAVIGGELAQVLEELRGLALAGSIGQLPSRTPWTSKGW